MATAKKTVKEEVDTPKVTTDSSINKDGFKKGEVVSEKDYFKHLAKTRNKK